MTASGATQVDPRLAGIALLSVEELGKALGVSIRTVRRLTAAAEVGKGTFPQPVRLGPRLVRWKLADVDAYLAALAEAGK